MSNAHVITQMQSMLAPTQKQLKRWRLGLALREALALGTRLVPITLAATLLVGLLATPRGMLNPWQLALVISSIPLCVAICLVLKCLRPLLQEPSWQDTAAVLDRASNEHNLIATAYDRALQNRSSLFARMAVDEGVATLEKNTTRNPDLQGPAWTSGKTRLGLLLVAILIAATILVPHVGSETALAGDPASVDLSGMESNSAAPSEAAKPRDADTPEQRNPIQTVASSTVAQEQQMLKSALVPSRAMAGTSQSQTGPAKQPFTAQSPSANAAKAQASPPSQSRGAKAQTRRSEAKQPSADQESTPTPEQTKQRAGNSAAPDAESKLKASLLSGETDEDTDLDNTDDKTQDKPQERALAGTGGQPLLSDRLAAPSRELGMSGKKSDKPPEGRGGPSGQKKSRATAVILSGMPVPVHVKGMKQPGKSKSQARALPLGPSDIEPEPEVTATTQGQDGQVPRYTPPAAWQAVIDRYYQSLRAAELNPKSKPGAPAQTDDPNHAPGT